MDAVNEIVQPVRRPSVSLWRTAVVLFKLRIVSLLVLSAFGGAGLGTMIAGRASVWDWVLLAITGTLSAAGASGINQYLERDRDSKMNRTAARPLATGQIENPHLVLLLGVGMVFGATGLAAAFNLALAFWVFLGAVIYVGVYTVWLKPRTTLNIVIGGAAGSCAVISGGAAVGAWSALGVWILAALVFVWTPVHFWALALAYRSDYIKADYPMLPARVPPIVAARWTAVHTILTAVAGMALGFWPAIDWFYLVPIGLATAVLIVRTIALLAAPAEKAPAFALFHFSNLYLALVLVVVLLASLWR
ncbi:heme o synthase [Candidatus Leptofilum sp.]|uniref:heme o synthase n=1 Tax=Candidatus Leptofilum sp. TaxID=3241576 RepID=UPI003B5C5FD7